MSADEPGAARRRSWGILAFALAAFFALIVFALGMLSLLTGDAVIAEPGLGQLPGIAGTLAALVGFAAVTAPALRGGWTGFGQAVGAGIAAGAAYCAGVLTGCLVVGVDPLRAAGIAGGLLVSWVAPAIAVAGALTGVGVAALVRAGPGGARWPWEKDE